MKMLIAALAESGNIGPGGKLHIRGVLDMLGAPTGFPFTVPPVTVVLHFELEASDNGHDHHIRVDATSGDGTVLTSAEVACPLPKLPPSRRLIDSRIIPMQLPEALARAQAISFNVYWDDRKQQSLILDVRDASDEPRLAGRRTPQPRH